VSARKGQLLPLTAIRFFLAVWVVLFHQGYPDAYLGWWLPKLPELARCVLRTGFWAVGVFFVLSGFVLSYNYSLDKSWSSSQLTRFGAARFGRIYPAYCLGLLLMAPFTLAAGAVWPQIKVAVLNATLLQAWLPSTLMSWNYPGWSLSHEAFFYCCFPLVGLALWRLSSYRSILTAGSIILGIALIGPLIAVSIPLTGWGTVPAVAPGDRFWVNLIAGNPLFRLPDFCIGIVTGRLYHLLRGQGSMLVGRGYWLYVPGILLEILAIRLGSFQPYSMVLNELLVAVHAAVVLGFALGGGMAARCLSVRPLVFLGNASYSVYILQIPVALWMNRSANWLFSAKPAGFAAMPVYLAVLVGVSSLVFKLLEEPANLALKKGLASWFEAWSRKGARAAVA